MLSGVPNLAVTLGYTNASWTLKADLMRRVRLPAAQPHGRQRLPRLSRRAGPTRRRRRSRSSTSDSGYVLRSLDELPKQGDRTPWRLHQNYALDILLLRRGPIEDDAIAFSRDGAPVSAPPEPVAV